MRALRPALGLLGLARMARCDSLPYNPTRIFVPTNSSCAYVFQPSSPQLSTLDFSDSITTTDKRLSTISDKLPFLRDDEDVAYTPAIDTNGDITVFTGSCGDGASNFKVWRFEKDPGLSNWKGRWMQHGTSHQDEGESTNAAGPKYLANGITFSEYVESDDRHTSAYIFGGMCPFDNSTEDTWVSAAEYSNYMLNLFPGGSGVKYRISLMADRGPPIPQAGTSITPLNPTYSIDTTGEAQTQQQDFVLLGGHTQAAFINTSQVALFSLPQESWSFIPVQQPSNAKTDLTVLQSVGEVTPRSGHTAVLSESGNSIILFGGWVGDTNTPADPQLAVLELGAGYGGDGQWQWTVPKQSGNGLAQGTGIYGHGATMLPGGVMMVLGGYDIPVSSPARFKRDTQSAGDRMLLYNTTSHAWLESYSLPESFAQQSKHNSGPLSSHSEKVGLGAGLGMGAALVLGVVAFYVWYSKRLKRAREDRERVLLTYSSEGSSTGPMEEPFLNHGGIDGRGGDEAALGRFWPTGGQAGNAYPRPPPMQHTTGMFVNVPSPTRGLRRGNAGKSYQYHAAPRHDDNRHSRGSGQIHSIAEQENEDEQDNPAAVDGPDRLSDAERKLRDLERVLMSEDPFADPEPNPLGSHPIAEDTVRRVPTGASRMSVPPRRTVRGEQMSENWTVENDPDDDAAEGPEGWVSPTKSDDRTSSTLSDVSQQSITTDNSITRTMSTRTGAILAAAAAAYQQTAGPQVSPTRERTQTMSTIGSRSSASYFSARARSSTNGSVTPGAPPNSAGGDSFMTSRSNFVQLQSEGEAQLGGRPPVDPDDPYQRALAANSSTQPSAKAGASNNGPPPAIPPRRRPGLFGSLRRALNVVSLGERTFSLTSTPEHYRDDPQSSSSSPTKERTGRIGSTPRRAVSDGGALLRQKRGEKDWDEKDWLPYRDNPEANDWGEPKTSDDTRRAEEDWDVEGAASNRDFQVMFTVPKSRLRVVNDDMDRASLRSASDGAVSRSGSLKTVVRHEESIKALRARSEGQSYRLPSTEEEKDDSEKEKAA